MKLFGKNLDTEVAIVAEIGVNHEGNVDTASRLIRLAAEAGADAVKFQSYSPERFVTTNDTERYSRVKAFCLSQQEHEQLALEASSLGVQFFSTAVTEDMVQFLSDLCGVIKIASGDLTFKPVIVESAQTGKPLILSTGLGTVEEIDRSVGWIEDTIGASDDLRERLILLHCVSSYPTPLDQVNTLSIPYLVERYGVRVGYSHHALEIEPCLAAVTLGACVIETHFTDQKNDREFRDHALSLEPDQLADLVSSISAIQASLGSPVKERQECELPNLDLVRKGIIAARDLSPGTVVSNDDVMYARPATEFSADEISDVIGKTLIVKLKKGQLVPRSGIKYA